MKEFLAIALGAAGAYILYNWYESNQAKQAAVQSTCPSQAELDAINQSGALAKAVGAPDSELAPLRSKLVACGYTPTF